MPHTAPKSDDWPKVSGLAERRRLQNRIAQRNYRRLSQLLGNDIFQNDLLSLV